MATEKTATERPIPAFPTSISDGFGGMTLRDYFAAKAMQALIALDYPDAKTATAVAAYYFADEMMRERAQ